MAASFKLPTHTLFTVWVQIWDIKTRPTEKKWTKAAAIDSKVNIWPVMKKTL